MRFSELKTKTIAQAKEDAVAFYNETGEAFDADKSDWDAEGLIYQLSTWGIRRGIDISDEQYKELLTSYSAILESETAALAAAAN